MIHTYAESLVGNAAHGVPLFDINADKKQDYPQHPFSLSKKSFLS